MKRKWTKARRVKFDTTIRHRKARNHRIKGSSHFYRLVGTELVPVKVKHLKVWVIE